MDTNEQGKKFNFNIVSSRNQHRGFGSGVLDLNSMSSIIVDQGEAYLDMGAMHAKSKVERLIRFSTDKADVPNGRRVWVVWVTVDLKDESKYYAGVTASEMLIDTEAKKGWKILADHVNRMDASLKRKVMVEEMDSQEKAALKKYLMEFNPEWWEHSDEQLKTALS
jgi:hypothetical protein